MKHFLWILFLITGCTSVRISHCPDPGEKFQGARISHSFKFRHVPEKKRSSSEETVNEGIITASIEKPAIPFTRSLVTFPASKTALHYFSRPKESKSPLTSGTNDRQILRSDHFTFPPVIHQVDTSRTREKLIEAHKSGDLSFWMSLAAVASIALSPVIPLIGSAFLPLTILGFVFGLKSLRLFKELGVKSGRGRAWFGTILGGSLLALFILALIILAFVVIAWASQ